MTFKDSVYNIVKKIPRGKVMTYRQVAYLAGRPESWRAVGNALSNNYDTAIPCHRVVRSDGAPGGYNKGRGEKLCLLKKEGVVFKKGRIVI